MGKKTNKPRQTTLKSLKKKIWIEFSKYIRFKYSRNGYVKCYTCGKVMEIKESQCGHGLGGRNNSILFDEEICRPQCAQCNIFKGGNYDIFHAKLIKENGLDWFEKKLRQKSKTKQFTIKELQDKLEYYKNENKKYEN